MTNKEAAQHGMEWADLIWSEGLEGELETNIRQCWRATCKHESVDGTAEHFRLFDMAFRYRWSTHKTGA